MDDGVQEYMKRRKKRYGSSGVLAASLCVLVALTGIFWYLEYRSYEEKMEIICTMLTGQEAGRDNMTTAASLLRHDTHGEVVQAAELLADYGFHTSYRNEYKRSMYRTWLFTAVALCAAEALFLLYLWQGERRKQRQNAQVYDDICGAVAKMREQVWKHQAEPIESLLDLEWEREASDDARGRLAEELSSLQDNLLFWHTQAVNEKEETKSLVTDISHQLKTPVAALKTSFEITQEQDLSEAERAEFTERCRVQIVRLEELIAALLGISRMETGMILIRCENRNIFDTLLLALNRIYPEAEKKDIAIALEGEKAQELLLPHDVHWLSEAFINVLENAVKYSPAHASITIRLMKMNIFLRIEIEDEGIGIPKDEWNLIFKRFYRGTSDVVQQCPGTGVGLYLARRIVKEHQGTLTVTSPLKGGGSKFVFQLPLEQ